MQRIFFNRIMIKIDGKKIAQEIFDELKRRPVPNKSLVAVQVGDNEASLSFLKQKERVAQRLGVDFKLFKFDEWLDQKELEKQVERLGDDRSVGGIILQLPLPNKLNREAVILKIDVKKDVDNLTSESLVKAPAVGVVKAILKEENFSLINKKAAVVGYRGKLVGGPIYRWLASEGVVNKGLVIIGLDLEDSNLKQKLADVDLVISGVGHKGLIDSAWLKNGAGVIDFGFPPDLKIGDFSRLKFYTLTPGGTGPILVAELFRNFYRLAAD